VIRVSEVTTFWIPSEGSESVNVIVVVEVFELVAELTAVAEATLTYVAELVDVAEANSLVVAELVEVADATVVSTRYS
jgi:hypothetical protein